MRRGGAVPCLARMENWKTGTELFFEGGYSMGIWGRVEYGVGRIWGRIFILDKFCYPLPGKALFMVKEGAIQL